MIYHLHVESVSCNTKSASAVGLASYISADKITADYTGVAYDYSRKPYVEETHIFLPENAPERFADRSCLWNEVEKIEKPKNGKMCQAIDAAIPNELNLDEAKEVFYKFGEYFAAQGIICDAALHAVPGNMHLHCLLTTRPVDQDGFVKFKTRSAYKLDEEGNKIPLLDQEGNQKTDKRGYPVWQRIRISATNWDTKEWLLDVRKEWENLCNDSLERSGIDGRIDCRSYEAQGIDRLATRHEGRVARELADKGIISPVIEDNQRIRHINHIMDLIEKVGAGIDSLKGKIETVKFEAYQDFMELFRKVTGKADKVISEEKLKDDRVDKDIEEEVTESEEDPVDRDWWNDPV